MRRLGTLRQVTDEEATMAQSDETTRLGGSADPHPTSELPTHDDTGTGWPGKAATDDTGERPAAPGPAQSQPVVIRTGGGFLRGLFFATATVATVVAIILGMTVVGILPKLQNPFGSRTTDRSQPVLLRSIKDLSRFTAAEGNYQEIVDIQKDSKYLPDFLVNDRTLFVAVGSVEAYVDFGQIGQGAITESGDHKSATIKLPAPQLTKPNLDHDKSYVFAEQQGLLTHLAKVFANDPNKLQELYKKGEERIGDAAKSGELTQRAEKNTRAMLEQLLRSLGYTSVTVNFASP
jgi:hypothetical protein